MVETITTTDIERDNIEVLSGYFAPQAEEMRKYILNLYSSLAVGEALYDGGYLGTFSVIDRNYFISNYRAISLYFAATGTSEGYIGLFKALFGEDTLVIFNDSPPGTINVDVRANLSNVLWVEGITLEDIVTGIVPENIVFSTIFSSLDLAQTESLLKLIVPYGILATFIITDENSLINFRYEMRSF